MNKASVGYWQLLRQNSRFRRLWSAQLISSAGDWFNSVAVLGLVLQLTDSGLGASLVILCNTLPSFFLIPFAGPVVDRFDRRALMIITNVVSAGFALLFMLVHTVQSLWLLYLATILLVIAASFFAPASSASIPNIVSDEELFAANALSGATWGVMVMVGSALGGLVSAAFGRDIAFVVNAVSFIIAALLIATIDVPSPKSDRAMAPWQDFKEGLAYLRGHLPALGLVGVKLGWADTGGYKSPTQDLAGHVRSMILPTITLAVGQIAVYMRLLRSDMIATLQQDFITMAKAKGITTKRILFRHALRPSSLTLLTVAGLNIGTLIGGALIIEVVFNIPGLGYLMGEAIATRQIVMFQSLVAIIAIFYVFVNFCVDILYTVLDPRIRHAGT